MTRCSCRDACPSHRSQAIPEPRSEPASSPLQDRDHTRQRRGGDRSFDDYPPVARQHDLNPARRWRTYRDTIAGRWAHRRRACLAWCRPDDHRHEPAGLGGARRFAKQQPSPEILIGVEVVALGDHRHRNPRLIALHHDLPLLRLTPPRAPTTNQPAAFRARLLLSNRYHLSVHQEVSGHLRSAHSPTTRPAQTHPIRTGGLRRRLTFHDRLPRLMSRAPSEREGGALLPPPAPPAGRTVTTGAAVRVPLAQAWWSGDAWECPEFSQISFRGHSETDLEQVFPKPLMHMAPVARVCHQMLRLRLGRGNG